MSKHTPGEWSCERVWDIPETKVYAYCCGEPYAVAEVYAMPAPGEREANARLIAACPTMYSYIEARAKAGDSEAAQLVESINAGR